MTEYRKKPVVVNAIRWDGTNADAVREFVKDDSGLSMVTDFRPQIEAYGRVGNAKCFCIETLEGNMTAREGDWIIKGVVGEFYPCKPEIFAATYEPAALPLLPQPAALPSRNWTMELLDAISKRFSAREPSTGAWAEQWRSVEEAVIVWRENLPAAPDEARVREWAEKFTKQVCDYPSESREFVGVTYQKSDRGKVYEWFKRQLVDFAAEPPKDEAERAWDAALEQAAIAANNIPEMSPIQDKEWVAGYVGGSDDAANRIRVLKSSPRAAASPAQSVEGSGRHQTFGAESEADADSRK